MKRTDPSDVLRRMMIALPALLLAVTAHHAATTGGFEGSISAYYGGPVRDVFVGVAIATAACMVAYRGWFLLEDFALNAAGFFAVFVALVPAELSTIMADLRAREEALEALEASTAVTGAMSAALGGAQLPFTAEEYGGSLRAALLAFALLVACLVRNEWKRSRCTRDLFERGGWSRRMVVITAAAAACFTILTFHQLFTGPADQVSLPGITIGPLRADVHTMAAVLMMASLLVVVAGHAWPQRAARADPGRSVQPADQELQHTYKIIFGLMSLGAVCIIGLCLLFFRQYVVLIIEWYEIILFGWFWFLETRRVARCRIAPSAHPWPPVPPQPSTP